MMKSKNCNPINSSQRAVMACYPTSKVALDEHSPLQIHTILKS
uniref:Uncharacterized protein n=1 Tax=Arundo donax TaxID=35708 RepID=A0A0A9SCM0_ARUDO